MKKIITLSLLLIAILLFGFSQKEEIKERIGENTNIEKPYAYEEKMKIFSKDKQYFTTLIFKTDSAQNLEDFKNSKPYIVVEKYEKNALPSSPLESSGGEKLNIDPNSGRITMYFTSETNIQSGYSSTLMYENK